MGRVRYELQRPSGRVRSLVLALTLVVAVNGCATRTPERPTAPAPPPTPGARRTPPRPALPSPEPDISLRIDVGPRGGRAIERVPLEAYVRDVVVGELSVAAGDGALAEPAYQAQAVVARTYALAVRGRHAAEGFDLCSTTHCQVYVRDQWRRSRWAAQVTRAVELTRGRILAIGGRPIEAVFHAHCGGHTSTASEVWRSAGAPYLKGVPDPFCVREQPAAWTTTLDLEAVRVAVSRRQRTDVGERLDGVQVLRRDAGGRVVEVVLSGSRAPVVTGEDFRLAVIAAAGARSLRSARFDVRREGPRVVFSGRGAGHGVGLCQIGLLGRLRAGQSPDDALRAYYAGVEIVSLGET
jgi:stage II sporulation protein D